MEDLENTSNKEIIPVILCGGIGSRLWPLSRKSFPKQFLKINTSDQNSLLQKTYLRLIGLNNLLEPILVCNEEHRFIVAEQMRDIGVVPKSIMLEPFGRNTAPAILIAALKSLEIKDNAHLLILSADHQINNDRAFRDLIEIAVKYSDAKKLVTFGVIPSSPETGYGYIKSEKPFNNKTIDGIKISEFIEKPNLKKAKELIKDSSFTWNSGIFMFRANTIIREINELCPEIYKFCKETFIKSKKDLDFQRLNKESFKNCQNISIDNAVMEKTNKAIVLPLDAGWSDIGNWKSVWENSDKDKNGNTTEGNIVTDKTENCYLRSENKLLVSLGIKNLVIINTDDATLVADKNESENIKKVVEDLKAKNVSEVVYHKKVFRPWGFYLTISEGERFKVKIIHVNPGAKLSLQMHYHRAEHWVVVKGSAVIEIDNNVKTLSENESTYIPALAKHRIKNVSKNQLEIIEVQSGSYLGEDDIVRFEDIYGRKD